MSVTTVPPRVLSDTAADTVRGIALITLSYFIMTFSDISVKFVLPLTGLAAPVLFRGVVGSAAVLVFAGRDGRRGIARLRPVRTSLVLARSLLQAAVGISWFIAWQTMTLADSYAVGFTTPLLATSGAMLLLGEQRDLRRIGATIVGFIGVLIMLRPGGDLWSPALLVLLFGVACSAFARILTRRLSATETPECLAFSLLAMHLPVGLMMLPFLPLHGLDGPALAALVGVGLFSGVAQLINARAYALAPVSALGPFDYSSMLWAVALGWLCFGEMPHLAAIQGAVVIAAAGLYSLRSEQRRQGRSA
jgi:drug/metabolite transporter (DMT)-like permease